MKQKRIPCPHCHELILPNATKCPFCHSNLKRKSRSPLFKILMLGFLGLGLLFVFCVIYLAYIIVFVDNKFTGQELLEAVNVHRRDMGINELRTDEILCTNLLERWQAFRQQTDSQDAFLAWQDRELGEKAYDYSMIYELNGSGTQTYWLIENWVDSPEHRAILEDPALDRACAYADKGIGIVIFAEETE